MNHPHKELPTERECILKDRMDEVEKKLRSSMIEFFTEQLQKTGYEAVSFAVPSRGKENILMLWESPIEELMVDAANGIELAFGYHHNDIQVELTHPLLPNPMPIHIRKYLIEGDPRINLQEGYFHLINFTDYHRSSHKSKHKNLKPFRREKLNKDGLDIFASTYSMAFLEVAFSNHFSFITKTGEFIDRFTARQI
jgi:hypothetical protein